MEWYIMVNFVIVSIVSYYIGRLHASREKHKDWRVGTVWEKKL